VTKGNLFHKVLAVVFAIPAVVTVAVGANHTMRALHVGTLNVPMDGWMGVLAGLCCLATGWVAWQGLTALWKKL
jgi:hypothetical protein